jgi:hypothetical protein
MVRNRVLNSCRIWSTAQFNTPHTPPPPTQQHTVCIYCTFSLGRVGGGGQKEGRGETVHKYSSFVHGGNSSQAGSKIPTMSECISRQIKSVRYNAARFFNRSISKKSRHIGFGVFIVHSSMGGGLK